MGDLAKRTGASLIDFVTSRAREVAGRLLYPRSYLVTNAYFEADVVINIANCRSHSGIAMSGAIKNMFGCVIGLRKQHIHNVFLGDAARFGRAIADIYSVIPADFSFLDLTSVSDGESIHNVGLLLGSADAVALDTVAAHVIGYGDLPLWVTHYAGKFGLGCDGMGQISIRGSPRLPNMIVFQPQLTILPFVRVRLFRQRIARDAAIAYGGARLIVLRFRLPIHTELIAETALTAAVA